MVFALPSPTPPGMVTNHKKSFFFSSEPFRKIDESTHVISGTGMLCCAPFEDTISKITLQQH